MDRCRRPRIDSDEPERLAMEVMPKEDARVFDDWFQFSRPRKDRIAGGRRCDLLPDREKTHQRVDKPSNPNFRKARERSHSARSTGERLPLRSTAARREDRSTLSATTAARSGKVHWHKLSNGRPGWVTFPGLGRSPGTRGQRRQTIAENFVPPVVPVTDRREPSSGSSTFCTVNSAPLSPFLPNTREDSGTEKERNRERKGTGKGRIPSPSAPRIRPACGA